MTLWRELYTDERLDQTEELVGVIPTGSAKAALLEVDGILDLGDRSYRIVEVEDQRAGTELLRKVRAVATWYDLGEVVVGGSFAQLAATPAELLELALDGSGWTAGVVTDDTDTFDVEEQDRTVLELLRVIARVTGKFLVFNTYNNTVDLLDQRGRDLGTSFRYGRNVTGVRRRTTPPACTVLYAYGADGLTFAGVNGGAEFIEDFSYYTDNGLTLAEARALHTRERIVSDSSFLEEDALLAWAQGILADLAQPTVSYELDVIDLTELVGTGDVLKAGDRVRVFDPDLTDDRRANIVRLKRYPYEPHRDEVELAYILPVIDPDASSSRPSTALQWVQFIQNNVAEQRVRADRLYFVNRLPLTFRQGGKANFHIDADFTGAGDSGVATFELYEANADTVLLDFEVAYTAGGRSHVSHTMALEELAGDYDYRIRVTTASTGGSATSSGIDIAEDALKFYILAQGAIRQTPTTTTSERFDWIDGGGGKPTGTVQTFQVPDAVTELTVTVVGAGGADNTDAGNGALVKATVPVTPGEILDVYAAATGSQGLDPFRGGWPNGGDGRTGSTGGTNAPGGGGSSYIVRAGGAFIDALIVAAGGGGRGDLNYRDGGDGGIYLGGDGAGTGVSSSHRQGLGATQFAGGQGGDADDGQDTDGAFNQGGKAGDSTSSFSFGGGGGGGGWYGGGGGGDPAGLGATGDAGGGGGGSSWWAPDSGVIPLELTDGGGSPGGEDGYVLVEWQQPD